MDVKILEESIREIAELKPHPRNYKTHPKDQVEHIQESISAAGIFKNVVISSDDYILAGHGVVKAIKDKGGEKVPTKKVEFTHDHPEALKILTGDNEIGRLAEMNDRLLSEILKDMKTAGVDLLGTGFTDEMLANLVMVTRHTSEINDINEAREWVGMPSYQEKATELKANVSFLNEDDRKEFIRILGVKNPRVLQEGKLLVFYFPEKKNDDPSSIKFS